MMFSEIIDEIDFFAHLQKHVPSLKVTKESSLIEILKQAASLASEDEWQHLIRWLIELTQDTNLLLPEIQQALQSQWNGDRELPKLLKKQLG